MTPPTAVPWHRERSLRWLLGWTGFTTLIFWLPAVRGFSDGSSYQWALLGLEGRGVAGDYWLPVLGSAATLMTKGLAWQGFLRPASVLMAAWHLLLLTGVAYAATSDPDNLRLQGETLGVDVSLVLVGPALFGGWAVVAIYVVVRAFRRGSGVRVDPWTRLNSQWLTALLALLPIQFILLRFGPANGLTDQIGVLLTVGQWLLVDQTLRPRPVHSGPSSHF